MFIAVLNHLVALIAIALAFLLGGKSEREGGYVILIMIIFADSSLLFYHKRFMSVDLMAFCDDLLGFAGFSLIGIFRKRVWPLWAASLQLLSVGAHFVRALEIPVRPIVYAWMKAGPTWAVLVLLIIGSLVNRRAESGRESGRYSRN